ncbi:hypothetical protein R3P38DRAFT_2770743 [Favolaschia claudopus]|uniref:Uncharacterized protein n=1 Tax=Favolaschia claudopus TaxID=2862362 RepID=A0AAW0CI77_9AGAR
MSEKFSETLADVPFDAFRSTLGGWILWLVLHASDAFRNAIICPVQSASTLIMGTRDTFVNRSLKEGFLVSEIAKLDPVHPFIKTILSTYTDTTLFCIALHSKLLFATVTQFLSSNKGQPSYWNAPLNYDVSPGSSVLNWDVMLLVIDQLDLSGLRTISLAAKWLHDHARKRARKRINQAFEVWGLKWESVQWFLDMTESLVSGLTSTSILFPNRPTINTGRLDFYVHSYCEKAAVRFLKLAGQFKAGDVVEKMAPYVKRTIIFNHIDQESFPVPLAVHVVVSDNNPREAVFRQESSAEFTHIDSTSITVPYSTLTFRRETLANHPFVRLGDRDGVIHLNRLKRLSTAAGFRVVIYHDDGQACGKSLYCPSKVRTSGDELTSTFSLIDPAWKTDSSEAKQEWLVIWSMGKMGCDRRLRRSEAFIDVIDVDEVNETNESLWLNRFAVNMENP